ncbi:MAG: YdeI/OmpD-associated family protein [Nocardioidaceae bacterium]
MRFSTTIELGGKTATGFAVPDDVIAALGAGRRPAVAVTIGTYTYRTTAASMGGRFLVPLSAENRAAAGVAAGDQVVVDIEADAEPRTVAVPPDLADALAQDPAAAQFFEALAHSHRKEWARWVDEAKKPQTRSARVARAVDALRAGRRVR